MKFKFELFLIIFIINSTIGAPTKKSTQSNQVKSEKDAYAWLNKYGYNPCKNAGVQCSLGFDSIIKEYQERFRLKPTGKLDAATRSHMNRPRCGIEDKDPAKLSAAPQALRLKWSRSSLTYALKGYPSELSESKTSQIIREAFDAWLTHIPMAISATCSNCKSDFVVDFEREKHSDNYPFDGSGGTLAHAFFPEDGRIHFDKDEEWTESFDGEKINLYLVAVHEIGHALGLDHTYDEESIMYPSYKLMKKSDILPRTDRETIQKLYGTKSSPSTSVSSTARSTTTTTTTTTTKTTTTTRSLHTVTSSSLDGKIHPRCRMLLDAALLHPDGTFHTFNAGILWRYLVKEGKWEDAATSYNMQYPDLPRKINAGVYDEKANRIVFFSDSLVLQYDLDSRNRATFHSKMRLPKNLQNSIVGAIYYHNKIHVITAKRIRQYPFGSFYQNSKENDLDEEFPNFRGKLITAFTSGKSHYFFTEDRLVSVWSETSSSWSTLRKPMETSWFACTGRKVFIPNRFNTGKDGNRQGHDHHHHDHRHHS